MERQGAHEVDDVLSFINDWFVMKAGEANSRSTTRTTRAVDVLFSNNSYAPRVTAEAATMTRRLFKRLA